MPKEGDFINCPNSECNGQASWVCLGEPEGDFYSCERCNGEFDINYKEIIGDEKLEQTELEFLKEIEDLADKTTAKKAYQEYLDELRNKIEKRIEEVRKR